MRLVEVAFDLQRSLARRFRQGIGDRDPVPDQLGQREVRFNGPGDLIEGEFEVAPRAMRAIFSASRAPRGKRRWRGGSVFQRTVP